MNPVYHYQHQPVYTVPPPYEHPGVGYQQPPGMGYQQPPGGGYQPAYPMYTQPTVIAVPAQNEPDPQKDCLGGCLQCCCICLMCTWITNNLNDLFGCIGD